MRQHGLAPAAARLHAHVMRLPEASPFVLLDDARPDGKPARLYTDPVRIVRADTPDAVVGALDTLRAARRGGLHAAGFVSYEAGAALLPHLSSPDSGAMPLLWFGLFDGYRSVPAGAVPALLPDPDGAWAGPPVPRVARSAYGRAFSRISEWIAAGDIYQANLSFRATVPVEGDPRALYAMLRRRARAPHGALVRTDAHWLLSLSPELFFAVQGDSITARPMKGTAARGETPADDARIAGDLAGDAKQRAENLMIVDLLRNDLSRVAAPGSVAVPSLFEVSDRDAVDILAALFPCGSITGAPKLRAMQILDEIEEEPRGAYCGAIGRLDADGDAEFNVAIRTLTIGARPGRATLGLGSGVVADSDAETEWRECLAKGAFVAAGQRPFDLIETMAFDPDAGIALLDLHLERMKASARRFGFRFDRHVVRNDLQAATFRLRAPARVRLLLAPSGAVAIGLSPMPPARNAPLRCVLAPLPVAPRDFRLRHKTSDRGFYDAARRARDCDEVLFVDPEGYCTEGSFTSMFVARDGKLLTPPLARGLLPGVLRARLLASGAALEADLRAEDLVDGFLVGNALRGLMPAKLVAEPPAGSL